MNDTIWNRCESKKWCDLGINHTTESQSDCTDSQWFQSGCNKGWNQGSWEPIGFENFVIVMIIIIIIIIIIFYFYYYYYYYYCHYYCDYFSVHASTGFRDTLHNTTLFSRSSFHLNYSRQLNEQPTILSLSLRWLNRSILWFCRSINQFFQSEREKMAGLTSSAQEESPALTKGIFSLMW